MGYAIYKHYIRLGISCVITWSPNTMNTTTIFNYLVYFSYTYIVLKVISS